MKKRAKTTLFFILNFFLLLSFVFVLLIYASLNFRSFPWFQAEGWQFLLVIKILHPIFLGIGALLILLGFFFPISKLNRVIPFLSPASIYMMRLPISWGWDFNYFLIAFLVNLILFFLFIFTICKTMILIKNGEIEIK